VHFFFSSSFHSFFRDNMVVSDVMIAVDEVEIGEEIS